MPNQRVMAAIAAVGFSFGATIVTAGEASGGSGGNGANAYQDGWGPSVGEAIPPIASTDQDGNVRDLASLSGERGLLLVVSRSAVW